MNQGGTAVYILTVLDWKALYMFFGQGLFICIKTDFASEKPGGQILCSQEWSHFSFGKTRRIIMIKEAISLLVQRKDLSSEMMSDVMEEIMTNQATDAQKASF